MYTVEGLREDLIKKLETEQEEFKEELMTKSKEDIFERAYEITARQEIIDYISCSNIDLKYFKPLLIEDNLLGTLYQDWLKFDGNFYEQLEYCVDDGIEDIYRDFVDKNNSSRANNTKNLDKGSR